MRVLDPLFLGQHRHQVPLDLLRILLSRQPQQVADPLHMSINNHAAGDAETDSKNNVGRLASHSRQSHQVLDITRKLTRMISDQRSSHPL